MLSLQTIVAAVFSLFIKPFFLLVFVVILSKWFGRRSAVHQHLFLLFGFVALALMMAALVLLPSLEFAVLPADLALSSKVIPLPAYWLLILVGAWMLVAVWIVLYLVLGIFELYRLARNSHPQNSCEDEKLIASLSVSLGVSKSVQVLYSERVSSPFVWGWRSPLIMMPLDSKPWDERIKRYVYMHELTHVSRNDWLSMIFVRLCCAVFWFLPPAWWAARCLYHAAEIACDESVYRLGEDETECAQSLLSLARYDQGSLSEPGLGVSATSPVFQRVQALLDRQRERTQTAAEGWSPGLLLVFFLLLPYAALQLTTHELAEKWFARVWLALAIEQRLQPQAKIQPRVISLADLHSRKQELLSISRVPDKMEHLILVEPRSVLDFGSVNSQPVLQGYPQIQHSQVSVQGFIPQKVVTPIYPASARRRGIEGRVEIVFSIDTNGRVRAPAIVDAQPSGVFEVSVLQAVKKFKFQPQLVNGEAVIVENVTETFVFVIEPSGREHRRRPD